MIVFRIMVTLGRGMRKPTGVLEISVSYSLWCFPVFICKSHQPVCLRSLHFSICDLYLKKKKKFKGDEEY